MLERRLISVNGVVQGVGFRPYVHRLAEAHRLHGFVRNDAAGVVIDVQGEASGVAEFCRLLPLAPPALATIATVRVQVGVPRAHDGFAIAPSDASGREVSGGVPADAATCNACLEELFDPENRRYLHPFITCTDCGPRLTIVQETPYDRVRTTMAMFTMCADCAREYGDPTDRRYHAESIACGNCGPRLTAIGTLHDDWLKGEPSALRAAVQVIQHSGIVAIKALGGFHLACDGTDDEAVARLRARKNRPAKPFAVMVRDRAAAERICRVSAAERQTLESTARPIVLLARRTEAHVSAFVAPESDTLGVMLPSTPLHHLLLAAIGRPLVMTSGNRGGEPVAIDDASAAVALNDIAELVLTHDREIVVRCDDSVVRVSNGALTQVRRSRGYVPAGIALPFDVAAPVLAVGGHLKNTVCVVKGRTAHLSPHVGDLDTALSREAFRSAVEQTLRRAGARPTVIAHDLHPEYASTTLAQQLAAEFDVAQRIPVQHHHAHVAACMAEFGIDEPVIGVAFDGAGLGSDGAIWGGEFMIVHGAAFTRCGHLAYVPLPGGDAAARKPWRSAVAHMASSHTDAGLAGGLRPSGVQEQEWQLVNRLATRTGSTPRTSSVGRLFDAVASILGLCHEASYEGEAAMQLERLANGAVTSRYPVAIDDATCWTTSPSGIIEGVMEDVARGRPPTEVAAAFHGAMRDLVTLGCERIRHLSGLCTVVLTGGVFANVLLAEAARDTLVARGFRVLLPQRVPCNDGGLSLGQAYVAACVLREEPCA